jgi:hypothetical protein
VWPGLFTPACRAGSLAPTLTMKLQSFGASEDYKLHMS